MNRSPLHDAAAWQNTDTQPLSDEDLTEAAGGAAGYVQKEYYCPDCRRSFIKEKRSNDYRQEKCPWCKKPVPSQN